jgi:hypothetical protein
MCEWGDQVAVAPCGNEQAVKNAVDNNALAEPAPLLPTGLALPFGAAGLGLVCSHPIGWLRAEKPQRRTSLLLVPPVRKRASKPHRRPGDQRLERSGASNAVRVIVGNGAGPTQGSTNSIRFSVPTQ